MISLGYWGRDSFKWTPDHQQQSTFFSHTEERIMAAIILKDIEKTADNDRYINKSSPRIQHKIRTGPDYKSPPRLAGFVKLP